MRVCSSFKQMYVLRVSQYSMVMPLCADDPDKMGELQVWRLRTVKSSTEDMAVHQMLPSTDRDYHLQQIGVRKFDNALSRLPFFLSTSLASEAPVRRRGCIHGQANKFHRGPNEELNSPDQAN